VSNYFSHVLSNSSPQNYLYGYEIYTEMKLSLLSSSMIVAVAVSAAPIITTLPGMAASVAENVSVLSCISSFTTNTLIFCSVSLGAMVTGIFVCPMKSAGSEELLISGVIAASHLVYILC